jgi:hypothetical protein
LEEILFASAPSFFDYMDASTFKSRLLSATVTMMRRRTIKTQRHTRQRILLKVLGKEKFVIVRQLVQNIKDVKIQATLTKCLVENALARKEKEGCAPLQKSNNAIVAPVQQLFFNTSLINSFDLASVKAIPRLDWDFMIEQAERNLKAFKEWELEHCKHELN